jgi:ABC-2 type transport system ATP-binding protein
MAMNVLDVHEVRLSRSERQVLEGASFDASPGELVAIMGESGSGKTTLLRAIAGLEPFQSGRIAVDDVTLTGGLAPPATRRALCRKVGMVFQFHCLFEHLSALDNICLAPVHAYGMAAVDAERRARELLRAFGVEHRAGALPRSLSGGEAQRVAIARALAVDPPVLLLDEPTSAMDPHSARAVRDALLELKQDARAIVLCTHNLTEAEEIADRIAIIRRGSFVAVGTPAELKRRLLGAPLMELRLTQPANGLARDIGQLVDVESSGEAWVRFRTADAALDNPRLLRWLAEHGVDVLMLSEVPRRLEDVYLNVVK